jgi:hypothetical protein
VQYALGRHPLKPFLKIFFAIVCFGLGVGFGVGAIVEFKKEYWSNPEFPAAISGMFLLGAFLLLRRKTPTNDQHR